jgi:DNA topoisomerase VI subunit B
LVQLHWPDSASSLIASAATRFLQKAEDYAFLNPHLTLDIHWFGTHRRYLATDCRWQKWRPSDPTCPLWYTPARFARLVAAYLAHDQERNQTRTVRDFISEFRGFTGSAAQKAVLAATGLARMNLSALVNGDGLQAERVAELLQAMQAQARPVKPAALGVLGAKHLATRFRALGCQMETFQYRKTMSEPGGVPWVVEVAFACRPDVQRRLIVGLNFAPAIGNPFRQLGAVGQSLDSLLEQLRAGPGAPTVLLVHLAHPRLEFTDRGKSALALEALESDIDLE